MDEILITRLYNRHVIKLILSDLNSLIFNKKKTIFKDNILESYSIVVYLLYIFYANAYNFLF